MKIAVLLLGALLQFFALYVAFYSDLPGNVYLATLISVAAIACALVVRHLLAPVCLMAGVIIGLSLSHNETDLKTLSALETKALVFLAPDGQDTHQYTETTTEITHLNVKPLPSDIADKPDGALVAVNVK